VSKVSREPVIAYRLQAPGLHRDARAVTDLAGPAIGVRESGADAARLPDPSEDSTLPRLCVGRPIAATNSRGKLRTVAARVTRPVLAHVRI
jgi:hypothetical protein